MDLPRRVVVHQLLNSRYGDGVRPIDWADRLPGIDRFTTEDGEEIALWSDGQQSPPKPGWIVLITNIKNNLDNEAREANETVYEWTLYGIRPGGSNDSSDSKEAA